MPHLPRASRLVRALAAINMLTTVTVLNTVSILLPRLASAQAASDPVDSAAPAPKTNVKVEPVTVRATQPTALPSYIPTTIEGISAQQIEERINATDAQDALKYFPSLLVRKRYIGDYDHAVLATRASGTGNSARSLVYADGILLSNLLGNGASFTPRWGLVTPEEIARVDVLYGPFSAAFPGNSVGAVVDYITRMPNQFEAHAALSGFTQQFQLYQTNARYSGHQASASLGSRQGPFAWWINVNRLDSDGHPLVFATKVISTGTPGAAGTPVNGAVLGQNPRNQDQWIIAATNQTRTIQDHAKVKLAYDITPTLRASYTFGLWKNDAERDSQTYVSETSGNPFYAGNININGRLYTVAPSEISLSRGDLQHLIHGLSVKSSTRGLWDWEVAASLYDYDKDVVRSPLVARPAADRGGAGRMTNLNGTGWSTLALKGVWRPQGSEGTHLVDMGLQRDAQRLRTLVSETGDWIAGGAGARASAFQGNTELVSFYAQDTWRFADVWRATLGARYERWEAFNGSIANPTSTLSFASRSESSLSPKAAIAYQASAAWILKASLGRAVRNPTVSELYQGSISTNTIVNNDPNLKAEKSWTSEWTAERDLGNGAFRTTLFVEDTKDALYSQTNVTVTPNITNIQNVDQIRTFGLETAYQANNLWVRGFDVSGSLTFASSKIEKNDKFPASVGKWQPRVPRWRANLLATWRPSEPWSATVGIRYSGKQFNTLDNSDPNGFAYTGTSKFLVADVRIRYRFDRQWSGSMGIDNLNNYKYWNFHPYPQRTFMAELKFNL
jgi:iron complex outermembrane recepter protein